MKISKQTLFKTSLIAVAAAIVIPSAIPAHGDSLDNQIRALQNQAAQLKNQSNAFKAQANDYRTQVANLQAQIELLQTQISLSQAQYNKTSQEIDQAQADLDTQKTILNENIRAIYKQGELNSLEILASSDNFSDFVNRQEYTQKVKDKVTDAMAKITALKVQLEKQKAELANLLNDQKNQRAQLQSTQDQANSLLATAQNNAAAADQQVRDTNSQVAKLQAQQAAAIAALGGGQTYGGSGGYPWAGAPFPNSIPDPWGMYERQCVSYTAWKVANSGRHMPYWGGHGNANQWPSNARAAGIPVDGSPEAGDVGIIMAGPYGHAVYVEAVLNGGSKIRASQYNAANDGRYSVSEYSTAGMYFIHF